MKTYIYVLKHPETLDVRYVGKTNNLKRRFSQHKCKKCIENTGSKKLAKWLLKLLSNNMLPIMEVVEECEDNWAEREKYWISFYSIENLCNLSTGGEGVGRREETRSKIKKTLTGKKRTEDDKKAISDGMRGKKRPMSGKAISESNKERYKNKDERDKHSIKLRKKVEQYDKNGNFIQEFESAREASRILNIDCGSISKCCRNVGCKYAGGFIFRYKQ